MVPEVDSYLSMIEDLRSQVRSLIADSSSEALNWRPLEGSDDHATNSLAVMAAHVAGAEHFWIAEVIGRQPTTRNRDAEFVTQVSDGAELLQKLDEVAVETRQIMTRLKPADLDDNRESRGKVVPVRWAILHVIDHTALHLGHMQLTYQLWMGGQSAASPRWFERIRPTL